MTVEEMVKQLNWLDPKLKVYWEGAIGVLYEVNEINEDNWGGEDKYIVMKHS